MFIEGVQWYASMEMMTGRWGKDKTQTVYQRIQKDEFLPLFLCGLSAIGILPFAVMRFSHGDYIIGAIDTLIVITMTSLGVFVFRTHRVRSASLVLSVICLAGAVATVYVKGPGQVYWVYPAMIVAFYTVKPIEGVAMAALATIILFPALWGAMSTLALASFMVTLWITNALAYSFAVQTANHEMQLMQLAAHDPLTGAGNRRAMDEAMDLAIAHRKREQRCSSVLLIDLDKFKRINDGHGHAKGDEVLIKVSRSIDNRIRKTDGFFRIGGEEFVVLALGDRLATAARLAEDLRAEINDECDIAELDISISIGVAELVDGESAQEWLGRADNALYDAKRGGRNQVSLAEFPKSSISSDHKNITGIHSIR